MTWTTVYLIWPISTTICIPSLKVFCEIGGREGFNETLNMSITGILTLKIVEMLLVLGVLKTSINLSLLTSKNASLFVCVCVCACVRACACACVCVWVFQILFSLSSLLSYLSYYNTPSSLYPITMHVNKSTHIFSAVKYMLSRIDFLHLVTHIVF